MPDIVRMVSDGEELVLSEGEAFRIHPLPPLPAVSRKPAPTTLAERVAIRYMGFQDVEGRREYVLNAQRGDQFRRYAVWIQLAAFSTRKALLQDGPDICYQKLLREVGGSELTGPDDIEVTEGDLAAYRESHAPPARKSFSPPRPPAPAVAFETAAPVTPERSPDERSI
jgi:hypothetical protein